MLETYSSEKAREAESQTNFERVSKLRFLMAESETFGTLAKSHGKENPKAHAKTWKNLASDSEV